jgi:multiple sugar transport system substrate-binding protein
MKQKTKAFYVCSFFLIILFICSSCSSKEVKDNQQLLTKFTLASDFEAFIFPEVPKDYETLGLQFLKGKPVLFAINKSNQIVMFQENLVDERIILEKIPDSLTSKNLKCFMDEEETLAITYDSTMILMDKQGTILQELTLDGLVERVLFHSNDTVIVEEYNLTTQSFYLKIFDKITGSLLDTIPLDQMVFAFETISDQTLAMANTSGFFEYNLTTKDIQWDMELKGTTYSFSEYKIEGINKINENNYLLLLIDKANGNYFIENVTKSSIDNTNKKIITYQTTILGEEMKQAINAFNMQSEDYFVTATEFEEGGDFSSYLEKMNIEIMAGYGPDLFDTRFLSNNSSALDAGVLEDLTTYYQNANLNSDEYFSNIMDSFQYNNKIYAIPIDWRLFTVYVPEDIHNNYPDWNLETVFKILEESGEETVFSKQYTPADLLYYFISSSPNLHGIIDLENFNCDFHNELWSQLLQVSAKYGFQPGKENYTELVSVAILGGFSSYSAYDNVMDERQMVPVGIPDETGGHHVLSLSSLSINRASDNKEGAWAFIEFLLSDDIQTSLSNNTLYTGLPVKKESYYRAGQEQVDNPTSFIINWLGVEAGTEGVTKEQVQEYASLLEHSMIDNYNTKPIIKIIEEETDAFFLGEKTMEEVNTIIQNRVQLYLNEIK